MSTPEKTIVGIFVWQRTNKGGAVPTKWDIQIWSEPMPETKKSRETQTLAMHNLTEEEFSLGLDMLARIYPLAPQPKEPTT